MKLSSYVPTVLAAAMLFGLIGCNEDERDYVGSFSVNVPFTVNDKDGHPFQFLRGTYDGQFDVVLADDGSNKGFILESRGNKMDIPFRVASDFYIGSGQADASATGQNIGIQQSTYNTQYVDRKPYTTTESCTISSSEHVCDEQGGRSHCFDRTITRDGSRTVTITPNGYTEDVKVDFVDLSGTIVATMAFSADHTFESRDAGPCQ